MPSIVQKSDLIAFHNYWNLDTASWNIFILHTTVCVILWGKYLSWNENVILPTKLGTYIFICILQKPVMVVAVMVVVVVMMMIWLFTKLNDSPGIRGATSWQTVLSCFKTKFEMKKNTYIQKTTFRCCSPHKILKGPFLAANFSISVPLAWVH